MSQLIVAKNSFNFFAAAVGGVNPSVNEAVVAVIFGRLVGILCIKGVHNNKLDFHSFGNEIFYIYACVLTGHNAGDIFGKTCQIRLELDKYTVTLNRAYNSGYGFTGLEKGGVFLPCAEKLLI